MPRRSQISTERLAEERLSEGDRESADSLDLQLDVVDERSGRLIGRFGGRWDRRIKDYVGDAASSRVIRLHVGQLEAAGWFVEWLQHHIAGTTAGGRIFDMVCTGGRRGGKSAFLFTSAIAYALACPGSIVWCVTPSDAYFGEPIAYLESIMPRAWYQSLGAPHWTFFLANGSTIEIRSGHTARRMKQGRCDFAAINEGQAVPTASYTTLSASIVDVGGLVVSASNPPDVGDPGEWVADLAAGAETGSMKHVEHFFFDPVLNPHIDQVALEALAEKMDEHTFDVQVRGMFLLHPDSVLHAWDRRKNEIAAPADPAADITRQFTKHFEGRAFDDIVGTDVQNYPWIAAVRCRAYRNPLAPHDIERSLLHGVGESFIEQGDEVDCARELLESGCSHDRTMVIADASMEWQQQQRDPAKQRPQYQKKGSMDMFRGEGFEYVVPPDAKHDRNPSVIERARAANARISTKSGQRYLFVDPRRCPKTAESIRKWRTKKDGQPSRHSRHAHGGDALTYIVWRFFPRRVEEDKVEVQSIRRFAGRDRVKGFAQ